MSYCIAGTLHSGPLPDGAPGAVLSRIKTALQRPAAVFAGWRESARHRRDLASLDARVLSDIGLRRSLLHPACLLTAGDE